MVAGSGGAAISFSGLASGVEGVGATADVLGSAEGVDDGAGCSDAGGDVLGSVVGVVVDVDVGVGVGSALELGVSGSCASAPVVAPPYASTAAVVKAPILSRARLTDFSDKGIPQDPSKAERGQATPEKPQVEPFTDLTRSTVEGACEVALRCNAPRGAGPGTTGKP
jgi:hypothetical protein